jgi:hypothetical protein
MFLHGTAEERRELKDKLWAETPERTLEELQAETSETEQAEARQQAEMEEWRAQHQAARDSARRKYFSQEIRERS